MIIAVASGKGGTGKTTVSASLASVWDGPVTAVDLDVEEPNLHLFLNPEITGREKAYMEVPEADESVCTKCRACADLCRFKALSVMGSVLLTFPEMCHGCGGCLDVCPEGALFAGSRELGEVHWGKAGSVDFVMGRLRVGEAMSPPLMRRVKAWLGRLSDVAAPDMIVDAPPGVSCPAVNAVMDADLVLLVTEPTPFGLYDLNLAVEAFSSMGKKMGVVVNRAGLGDRKVYDYCEEKQLPIVAEIPYDPAVAEAYSKGTVVAGISSEMKEIFTGLASVVKNMADKQAADGGNAHA